MMYFDGWVEFLSLVAVVYEERIVCIPFFWAIVWCCLLITDHESGLPSGIGRLHVTVYMLQDDAVGLIQSVIFDFERI